jgi:hypothetical protein
MGTVKAENGIDCVVTSVWRASLYSAMLTTARGEDILSRQCRVEQTGHEGILGLDRGRKEVPPATVDVILKHGFIRRTPDTPL